MGEVVADPDRLLSAREVAALLGISKSTWSGYVSRGQAPKADDTEEDRPEGSRTHRWRLSTVRAYVHGRKRQAWKLPKVVAE